MCFVCTSVGRVLALDTSSAVDCEPLEDLRGDWKLKPDFRKQNIWIECRISSSV